jgi:hypothetical protein
MAGDLSLCLEFLPAKIQISSSTRQENLAVFVERGYGPLYPSVKLYVRLVPFLGISWFVLITFVVP